MGDRGASMAFANGSSKSRLPFERNAALISVPRARPKCPVGVERSWERPNANSIVGPSTEHEYRSLLLDLEELLIEQLRLLGGASYRQRLEIEEELSEVRRELECLGLRASK
jgi:hypothetical protein